jgi:hypothetical protein
MTDVANIPLTSHDRMEADALFWDCGGNLETVLKVNNRMRTKLS